MPSPSLSTLALLLAAATAHAATSASPDDGWRRVQQLAPGTRIHITADHGTTTCKLRSADEASISCAGVHGRAFARSSVHSVTLTRYTVSTAAGLGIGAGLGALVGVAAIRPKPKAFLDFPAVGRSLFAAGGGLGGAALFGPVDAFRGPTIYASTK